MIADSGQKKNIIKEKAKIKQRWTEQKLDRGKNELWLYEYRTKTKETENREDRNHNKFIPTTQKFAKRPTANNSSSNAAYTNQLTMIKRSYGRTDN